MHIQNVVVGSPLVSPGTIFAYGSDDWERVECDLTYFTTERFLPKILVDIGFTTSISEIRRNRKDLVRTLDKFDFLEIKLGKKKCWILVGE